MSTHRKRSTYRRWRLGRVLIALNYLAIVAIAACSFTGASHFTDPTWQLHARFHLLWQTQLVLLAGLSGLWIVSEHWELGVHRTWIRLLPLVFWLTQMTSGIATSLLSHGALQLDAPRTLPGLPGLLASVSPLLCMALLGALLDRGDARRGVSDPGMSQQGVYINER